MIVRDLKEEAIHALRKKKWAGEKLTPSERQRLKRANDRDDKAINREVFTALAIAIPLLSWYIYVAS